MRNARSDPPAPAAPVPTKRRGRPPRRSEANAQPERQVIDDSDDEGVSDTPPRPPPTSKPKAVKTEPSNTVSPYNVGKFLTSKPNAGKRSVDEVDAPSNPPLAKRQAAAPKPAAPTPFGVSSGPIVKPVTKPPPPQARPLSTGQSKPSASHPRAEDEIASLKKIISQLQDDNRHQENQNASSDLSLFPKQIQLYKTRVDELASENKILKTENETARQDIVTLKAQIHQRDEISRLPLKADTATATAVVANLTAHKIRLENEKKALQRHHDEAQDKVAAAQLKTESANKELSWLKERYEERCQDIQELTKQAKENAKEIAELKVQAAQAEQQGNKILELAKTAESQKKTLEKERADSKVQAAQVEQQSKQILELAKSLEAQKKTLEKERAESKVQAVQAQQQGKRILELTKSAEAQKQTLQKERAESKTNMKAKDEEISALKKRAEKDFEKVKQIDAALKTKDSAIQSLREQLLGRPDVSHQLSEAKSSLRKVTEAYNKCAGENKTLQADLAAERKRMAKLQADHAKATEALDILRKKSEDLASQLTTKNSELQLQLKQSFNEEMATVQMKLQKLGELVKTLEQERDKALEELIKEEDEHHQTHVMIRTVIEAWSDVPGKKEPGQSSSESRAIRQLSESRAVRQSSVARSETVAAVLAAPAAGSVVLPTLPAVASPAIQTHATNNTNGVPQSSLTGQTQKLAALAAAAAKRAPGPAAQSKINGQSQRPVITAPRNSGTAGNDASASKGSTATTTLKGKGHAPPSRDGSSLPSPTVTDPSSEAVAPRQGLQAPQAEM